VGVEADRERDADDAAEAGLERLGGERGAALRGLELAFAEAIVAAHGGGLGRVELEAAVQLAGDDLAGAGPVVAVDVGERADARAALGIADRALPVPVGAERALDVGRDRGRDAEVFLQDVLQVVDRADRERGGKRRLVGVVGLDEVREVRHRAVGSDGGRRERRDRRSARGQARGALAGDEVAAADLVGQRRHVDAAHHAEQIGQLGQLAHARPERERPRVDRPPAVLRRQEPVRRLDARLAHRAVGELLRVARIEREQDVPPAFEVREDEVVIPLAGRMRHAPEQALATKGQRTRREARAPEEITSIHRHGHLRGPQ
jgi:hypothetical protein